MKESKEVFAGAWLLELEPFQKEAKMFYSRYWAPEKRQYITFEQLARMAPPGWTPLLEDLVVKLLHLGWDGGFDQIKEKFGGLRFYWGNNIEPKILNRIAEDVVWHAESQSLGICDTCGKYGSRRGDGWLYTLCDECWEEHKRKKEEPSED